MKLISGLVVPLLLLVLLGGSRPASSEEVPRVERVLTQAEQDALTPERVQSILLEGNERFVAGNVTSRSHAKQVRDAVNGQYPKAIILSCMDSRIPVEDVFDRGIGDLFVARIAGNFANTDILGSMEYACKISGAKLVLVLGHGRCGAVGGAIDRVEMGNLTATLENITPAVDALSDYEGERTSQNPDFVERVTEENVRLTMARIRDQSPILRSIEEKGEIRIVGGLYEMSTGRVTLIK